MTNTVTSPTKGSALSASWGAGVAAAISDLLPMGAAGGLVRGGVTGCGFQPLPQNRRDVSPFDFDGPFALYAEHDSEGNVSAWKLRNCIWNVGGVTHRAPADVKVEEQIDLTGGGADTISEDGGFVYVSFSYVNSDDASAHFAKDLYSLREEQIRYDKYCVPLYLFKLIKPDTSSGEEEAEPTLEIVDLRRAPQVQSFESGLEFGSEAGDAEGTGGGTTGS